MNKCDERIGRTNEQRKSIKTKGYVKIKHG